MPPFLARRWDHNHNGRCRQRESNPGCHNRELRPCSVCITQPPPLSYASSLLCVYHPAPTTELSLPPCSVCITQPPPPSYHFLPALCVSPSPHHWAITSSLLCVYHPAPTTELSVPPCSACITQPPPLSYYFLPALCVSPSPHHWAITSSLLCVYHPAPTTELSLPPYSACISEPTDGDKLVRNSRVYGLIHRVQIHSGRLPTDQWNQQRLSAFKETPIERVRKTTSWFSQFKLNR